VCGGMDRRTCRIMTAAVVVCLIHAASCSEDSVGTRVTLVNETSSMIRGIALVAGTDTLRADTLQSGAEVSWNTLLEPAVTFELSWVEGIDTRTISPPVLDSAYMAEELEFSILAGELDLKVSYRF
jgi:hypothetical protein